MSALAAPVIERVEVERLQRADYNPRLIKDAQFAALKSSLLADPAFFDVRPCLINRRPEGALIIYAGNMRYEAAKALGWSRVPCVITEIPLAVERARNLKDNNSYGEYVEESLAEIFHSLNDAGQDVGSLGFTPKQTKLLLEEGMLTDPRLFRLHPPQEVEPTGEADSQPGEVYPLGRHRLLCGDSTDPALVSKLLAGATPVLCLTDPPHSVNYASRKNEISGTMDSYQDPLKPFELLSGFLRAMPCSALVMTYGDTHLFACVNALSDQGWRLVDMCIWVKQHFTMWPGARYQMQHEMIWMCTKQGARLPSYTANNASTVFQIDRQMANNDHPTQRPMALWTQLLANHSQIGDAIYEPFAGSGTTLFACEAMQRTAYCAEISPHFCDQIRARYDALRTVAP